MVWCQLASGLPASKPSQEISLSAKTQDFLKLASYIILPQERKVLLQLRMNNEQEIFIESFWRQRDPTPGTPQNEYRDELLRRFQHVNKFFSRGTSREGWLTDKGRIYMILGEPASKHDFSGRMGIVPCEVWYYYGDKEKNLPAYFGLVFFQRRGSGEPRLYDPVSDGIPSLLLSTGNLPFDDYLALYERLKELVPDLAPVALSIIPGEIPYNFTPSPRESILLADILDSPKKDINPGYASHFLDYKGMVSTEYMTNFVDHTACVDVIQNPATGLLFLNFSLVPKTLSFDYFAPTDQYFCNLQLNASLRQGESVIFQYSKEFPVYFAPSESDRIKANGISIEDSFPVIEGSYQLVVLLQNSVGKEFTVLEQDIVISASQGRPRLFGPVVGYGLKEFDRGIHLPYKVLDKKLLIDPSLTFAVRESPSFLFSVTDITESDWRAGRVEVTVTGSKHGLAPFETITLPLNAQPFGSTLYFIQTISDGTLPSDYYVLEVVLRNGSGQELDKKKVQFIVSPNENVPHPIAQTKMARIANPSPLYVILATQSEKTGQEEDAEAWYERAHDSNPLGRKELVQYSRFLIRIGKPEKSMSLIENIKDESAFRFDYVLIKGLAKMAMGKTEEAVECFLEGNRIYNSDTLLLNSLGTCYLKLGQKDNAEAALRASLRLNPEQEDVKKLITEIEKKCP